VKKSIKSPLTPYSLLISTLQKKCSAGVKVALRAYLHGRGEEGELRESLFRQLPEGKTHYFNQRAK